MENDPFKLIDEIAKNESKSLQSTREIQKLVMYEQMERLKKELQ